MFSKRGSSALGSFQGVETVQAAAALNEEAGELSVFVIHADLNEPQMLSLDVRGFGGWEYAGHTEMFASSPDASNSYEHPDVLLPRKNGESSCDGGIVTARLEKASWNILHFTKK